MNEQLQIKPDTHVFESDLEQVSQYKVLYAVLILKELVLL